MPLKESGFEEGWARGEDDRSGGWTATATERERKGIAGAVLAVHVGRVACAGRLKRPSPTNGSSQSCY